MVSSPNYHSGSEFATILIVDDEPANLSVISALLESAHFRVLVARDGESGLQKAQYAQPDLILLDVKLPGISGFETCSQLKADERTKGIPVIFMTVLTDIKDKIKGFDVGGVDYIAKPVQPVEVLARVSTHLKIRSQNIQLQRQAAALAESVEETQKARETAETALSETRTLLKAAHSILGETQIPELCKAMLQHCDDLLNTDQSQIYLVDSDQRKVLLSIVEGRLTDGFDYDLLDTSITGEVLRSGRPVLSPIGDDIQQNRLWQIDAGSMVSVPLIARGKIIGILATANQVGRRQFTRHDVDLLLVLAAQAATAIENVRLVERMQAILEKRLSTVVSNAPVVLFALDQEGVFTLAEGRGLDVLNYTPEKLIGLSAYELWQGFPQLTDCIHQAFAGESLVALMEISELFFEMHLSPLRDEMERVTSIIIVGTDVTERIQAEKAEHEQRELATTLVETAEAINQTLDFDRLFEDILLAVGKLVPHQGSNIMLIDDSGSTVSVVKSCDCYKEHGLEEPAYNTPYLLANLPHLQEMIDSGEPLVIPDIHERRGWAKSRAERTIQSYVGMPIYIENKVIGFLNVDSVNIGSFNEKHAERLKALATQVASALRNADLYRQLQNYSQNLEVAVQERTAKLEKANEELRVLSRVKDEFVSNVSHELRTPITSLKLYLHLLELKPEQSATYFPILQREAARLEHIIEDLLLLSRIDQRHQTLKKKTGNLNDLVDQYVSDRKLIASQNSIELSVETTPGLPDIQMDIRLIGQVLGVLLTNALSYTPAGGSVTVQTCHESFHEQEWIGFCVQDTGPGISLEEQARIFERFFRGESGYRSGSPGTGLGLAIAKEILDQHAGLIEVESAGIPGEGTMFNVWLPLEPAPDST
ncbi:MAG: GAF domain-containing protein [Anaerolineae bacterium]|nr:GAF domain-containing protein [Anaerolineae bacterium]